MKPEAEPLLKPVFARIGKPADEPFRPDPFQTAALEAVAEADCLVMAPTGSGKTWIAQEAIRAVFSKGGRCWYASPLKALTNAKWVEFGDHFDIANVGILTGDTKENAEAPIIVGTTEILRNQLYDAMHRGENLRCDLVILDEAHFLGDRDRGVVWEEIMIYLPARINLLLLSATIGNGEEIAAWLAGIRGKPCRVIREEKRPVPLYPLFLHPSGRLMPLIEENRLYGKINDFMSGRPEGRPDRSLPRFGDMLTVLERFNLLPAIFFLKSRSECDAALKLCQPAEVPDDDAFQGDLGAVLTRSPFLADHRQLPALETARVAAHHGGQLPAWKFLVEAMMKRGHLRAIFATSTVAAGVNFPARTIVLMNSDLFNGREFSPLTGTEFHQMTGRAGRRGQDRVGFMLAAPGRFMDLIHIRRLLLRKPEAIESRIRSDFSMILNLLLSQTPEDIREIFEKSLASYQRRQGTAAAGEERADLWTDFQRHLTFLRQEGFVDAASRLTENGVWASKLRLDQPLLIAEGLRKGVFPRDDEKLLAAVVAPFIYDGDQEATLPREIPRRLSRSYDRLMKALQGLVERLKAGGFPTAPLFLWPAVVLYQWARGEAWDRIITQAGIADGDLAMLIMRTADNLRQIASLNETHPEMAALAWKARETILREPVVFD